MLLRAAIGLLLLALVLGCDREPHVVQRVTLIGIDGASWDVIDPLLERGELPNMARLIEQGVRAPLRSRRPMRSTAIWTAVATGVPRELHGILNFFGPSGQLVSSADRRVPALWTLASRADLPSAVIGWWATYPAEQILGAIVSERALKTREGELREMKRYWRPGARAPAPAPDLELARMVHPPDALASVSDLLVALPALSGAGEDRDAVRERMRAEDAAVVNSLLRLRASHGPFRLEMILLRGVDPVSHHFWQYHAPDAYEQKTGTRPTDDEIARYGSAVTDHYRHVDTLLGELDVRASPEHVVMLLSDHGFEAGQQQYRHGVLSGTHESEDAIHGILVASGGPLRQGVRVVEANIYDIAPTTLHLLGRPVPEDMVRPVLTEALQPAWLAQHPVVAGPAASGAPVDLPEASQRDTASPVDDELRDELRSLGYIE